MVSVTMDNHLTEGYKHPAAYDSGYLPVGPIHRLHDEQYGKSDGKPVVFLHGGPGHYTSSGNTIFFDPTVYRVVRFDQRGCGKSELRGELRENTSQHLVADIEALREHFGIKQWHMVFGGSWGSTLALLYAQTLPDSVGSLVLRGVFTVRKAEILFARGFDGAAMLYPELFEEYLNYLPPEDRENSYPAYLKLLTSDDYETRLGAARAWNKYEMGISHLVQDEETFADLEDDAWSLQIARIEIHYETNGAFLEEGQLLKPENIAKIRHIPFMSHPLLTKRAFTYCKTGSIVQGRYNIVCPPKTAWDLHKALPDSKLYMIPDAGHNAMEPGTKRKLIEICDEFRTL